MCNIVNARFIEFAGIPDQVFKEGDTEITLVLNREDTIVPNQKILNEFGGQIFCRHPGTDWHLMEVEPGQGLECPSETELKMVLSKPFES